MTNTVTNALARRRTLLPLFGVLVLAVVAAAMYGPVERRATATVVSASAASAATRPNIVVVMADDMRTDDLRFMPAVRSLLVRNGLTFRNSFSPYPLCCPARASFLTGEYAHNHRVFSHTAPWGFEAFDDRATLATALHGSGYRTAFVGKYLNGYGKQPSKVTGGSSFQYVPNGWTDWYAAVQRPPGSPYRSGGTYNYMHTIFNVNGSIDDTHRGEYQTSVLGRFSRSLVRRYAGPGRPFFMWVSAVAPHFGGPREKGDPTHVRDRRGHYVDIATPARPTWVRGHFDRQIQRASGKPRTGPSEADVRDKPRTLRFLPEPSRAEWQGVRDSTRQRAEALFVLDRQVKALVATLKATGEWRNTVLMFTSDNGYFLGEHRKVQGKINAHEPSLRVPLVVAGRGIPHGERFDPATTPGLTATVAQLAGATGRMPVPADGISLVPSFRRDRGWRAPVVTEGRLDTKVLPSQVPLMAEGFHDARNTIGIRTARWKYVEYSNGDTELYDLDTDPNELTGLQDDPKYAHVKAELRKVWLQYKDCRGAACRVPLPANLQRSPAQNHTGTNAQSRGVQARYGHWR
ncbi:MAG: sulfatase [Nocardioidaceae bacterium]|nr:sulfatase [Nocardioidaceae bacterium]NUS52111.1 sulfatase [Nocardioidaceae bacterium]